MCGRYEVSFVVAICHASDVVLSNIFKMSEWSEICVLVTWRMFRKGGTALQAHNNIPDWQYTMPSYLTPEHILRII